MANTEQPVDFGGLSEKKIQQFKEKAEKSKARREAHEKTLRADYDKRKAALEAKHPNLKKFGISESIAATPVGKFGVRGIQGRIADAALIRKFQQEDKAKRVKELAAKMPNREERAAFKQRMQEGSAQRQANIQKAEAREKEANRKYAAATAKAPPANAPATIPARPAATAKSAALSVNPANIAKSVATAKPAPAATAKPAVPAKAAYVPPKPPINVRKGGSVKSSASSRGDGIVQRGKTKGRYI